MAFIHIFCSFHAYFIQHSPSVGIIKKALFLTNAFFLFPTGFWILNAIMYTQKRKYRKEIIVFVDIVFQLAFISSIEMGIIYWIGHFLDQNAVIATGALGMCPLWHNIISHGGCSLLLMTNLLFAKRRRQLSWINEFFLMVAMVWICVILQIVYTLIFGQPAYGFQRDHGVVGCIFIYIIFILFGCLLNYLLKQILKKSKKGKLKVV